MQSKFMSFVESWADVLIGFGINFAANMVLLPVFGYEVTALEALGIGLLFIGISVVRSYCIRRRFNGFGGKK